MLGLRLGIQATTLIILARLLGPAGFASYAALGALAVLLGTLSTAGTHLTLLRDVSRNPSVRTMALQVALGTTTVAGGTLLALYVLLSRGILGEMDPTGLVTACLGLSELILQPFLLVAALALHAQGMVVRSQLMLTLPLGLRLCAALLVFWMDPLEPLVVFAIGHLLAVVGALAIGIVTQPEKWPRTRTWQLVTRDQWRDSRGYALVNMSTSGISELDKVLAAKLLPADTAGSYAAASRVVGATVLPVIAMMLAAMPRLFRESALATEGRRLRLWLFHSAAAYGVAIGLATWALGPYIELVFGKSYQVAGSYLQWLSWMMPALALRGAAMNILTTLEQPWPRVALETAGWILMALLAYVLAPSIGAFGLVVSVICVEWFLAGLSWTIVWRLARLPSERSTLAP